MSDTCFGALGDARKAVQSFVVDYLEAGVLRGNAPRTIHIDVAFAEFLTKNGVEELIAAEVAADQRVLVRRRLEEQIERWRAQGVTCPLNRTVESEDIVVSWSHDRFTELTGFDPPDGRFVSVHEWVRAQSGREFLLPCLCFLKIVGCDPIFITDGSFDEGIDCIGKVASGSLRSTAIFIQARSRSDLISSEVVMQEYAKYAALPRTVKYRQYLEALAIPTSSDGAAFLYAIMTNSDFKQGAQEIAWKLGVLLRSRRQLAQVLASRTDVDGLETLKTVLTFPKAGDLMMNFASHLAI